jgi:hypothetical protein
MKRTAALVKVTALGLVLGLVAVGGLAMYYYTLPPSRAPSTNGATMSESSQLGGHYMTVEYNGTSYNVPAKGPNNPTFACPPGTDPGLCTLLQETCGNGVGSGQEPWKTCYNCVFDAGCTGDNTCDPYTHGCSSPATACMVAGGYGT